MFGSRDSTIFREAVTHKVVTVDDVWVMRTFKQVCIDRSIEHKLYTEHGVRVQQTLPSYTEAASRDADVANRLKQFDVTRTQQIMAGLTFCGGIHA